VLVGVALERSPELLVALWPSSRLGACLRPPIRPRGSRSLADTRAPVVVTLERHAQALAPHGATPRLRLPSRCCCARRRCPRDRSPAEGRHPVSRSRPRSGVCLHVRSSGVPLGVCVLHRAVVRLVTTASVQPGPGEVLLQYAPPLSMLRRSRSGARCYRARALLSFRRARVARRAGPSRGVRVTTLWLTAGLFQQVVETRSPGCAASALSGRRITGSCAKGPRATPELMPERLRPHWERPSSPAARSCGRDETRFARANRTSDRERRGADPRRPPPLPIGMAGEVATGGDGLARLPARASLDAERCLIPSYPASACIEARRRAPRLTAR
jgi:non-ribosomal peptide synthetase component F